MSSKTFEVDRKDLKSVLSQHYTVDFYQREYKWNKSQMIDLLEDLYFTFEQDYLYLESRDELHNDYYSCHNFRKYFLGSIVISNEDLNLKIVDGQQRLTSLTLILLYLLKEFDEFNTSYKIDKTTYIRSDIVDLIQTHQNGGRVQYNINTEQVNEVFPIIQDETATRESKNRLISRYWDTVDFLQKRLTTSKKLNYFLYWLRDNVLLVEIRTFSNKEAFTVFETMNDRGLSLTNHEMLKGFILSRVKNQEMYTKKWDSIIKSISSVKNKGEVESIDNFFSSVMQGHYAKWELTTNLVKHTKKWSTIQNNYYRWIKENSSLLGLDTEEGVQSFVENIESLAKWYVAFYDGSAFESNDHLFEMTYLETTHQKQSRLNYILPVLFSVINPEKDNNDEKVKLVGRMYDTLYSIGTWNGESSRIQNGINTNLVAMFQGKEPEQISLLSYLYLKSKHDKMFDPNHPPFYKSNNKSLQYLLVRIHDLFEEASGKTRWLTNKKRYDIEHILANHSENMEYFEDEEEFEIYRNQIGALLILPQSINSSYRDDPISKKVSSYLNNSTLSSLLSPAMYESGYKIRNNPGLVKLEKELGEKMYPFSKTNQFGANEIKQRNRLYAKALRMIYNPEWFVLRTEMSLEELEILCEDDEHVNSDFFSTALEYQQEEQEFRTSDARQEILQTIYKTYTTGKDVELELRITKDDSVKNIFLKKNGKIEHNNQEFTWPTQVSNLYAKNRNGWAVLFIVDDESKTANISLVEARDKILEEDDT